MARCPQCNEVLVNQRKCEDCGWTAEPVKTDRSPYKHGIKIEGRWINRGCAWNDHGSECDKIGVMSQATNGQGPWYCRQHFARLMGWPEQSNEPPRINGFVSTPVVEEMRKLLKQQQKKDNSQLMKALEQIRQPLE